MVFPGHRTFCTVLRHVDPIGDAMLRAQGGVFARLRHWAFREIHCRKVPVADAKRDALTRFGVTGRMFNGVRFDLDQAVNGWRKGLEWRIGNIKDQIEATQERIASLLRQFAKAETKGKRKAKKSAVRLKRRRLDVLKSRLEVAERQLAAGRPRVCFGGDADLRRRDLARWRERRATRIALVGATGETCGNQSVHWDGRTLRVLLPAALTDPDWHEGKRYAKPRIARPEDWLVFPDVTFRYGQDELLRAVEDRRAVTWLVFLADDGRWHAHATVTDLATDLVTLGVEWGAVGLDLNVGEVAVTVVDRFGNANCRLHLPFPVAGTPEGKARGMMGEAARVGGDQQRPVAHRRACVLAGARLGPVRRAGQHGADLRRACRSRASRAGVARDARADRALGRLGLRLVTLAPALRAGLTPSCLRHSPLCDSDACASLMRRQSARAMRTGRVVVPRSSQCGCAEPKSIPTQAIPAALAARAACSGVVLTGSSSANACRRMRTAISSCFGSTGGTVMPSRASTLAPRQPGLR